MIPLHAPIIKLSELFSNTKEENYFLGFGKNILFTSDGRNALYLALKKLNLKKTDEIIMPAYCCYIVPETIRQFCSPRFVDINKDTFNIDESKIEDAVSKRTKALLIAHLYGNPCNMKQVAEIAEDKKLFLIEDCAQAVCAEYNSKPAGSFGDASIFSFWRMKDISVHSGGALLADDVKENFPARSDINFLFNFILSHSMLNLIKIFPAFVYKPIRTNILFPHFNKFRKFKKNNLSLSDYQIDLVMKQIKKLPAVIEKRRQNAEYFSQKLKNYVKVPQETKEAKHTFYRYSVLAEKREEIYNYLLSRGIEAEKMYDYFLADLPASRQTAEQVLNIPVHQELTKEDRKKIVSCIIDFYEHN
jgi:hypothetical protein